MKIERLTQRECLDRLQSIRVMFSEMGSKLEDVDPQEHFKLEGEVLRRICNLPTIGTPVRFIDEDKRRWLVFPYNGQNICVWETTGTASKIKVQYLRKEKLTIFFKPGEIIFYEQMLLLVKMFNGEEVTFDQACEILGARRKYLSKNDEALLKSFNSSCPVYVSNMSGWY